MKDTNIHLLKISYDALCASVVEMKNMPDAQEYVKDIHIVIYRMAKDVLIPWVYENRSWVIPEAIRIQRKIYKISSIPALDRSDLRILGKLGDPRMLVILLNEEGYCESYPLSISYLLEMILERKGVR